MKIRKVLAGALALSLMFSAVGCSGGSTDNAGSETPKVEKQFVTVVTGSTGGTYYPVGTIFATLWNEKLGDTGIIASAQASGGSVENLNMLKSDEAQLGIAMANLTLFAYNGEGKFKDNKFEDVRFVSALWPDVTQFVVTENSGINSIADIKGNSFNFGGAGSGTEYSTKLILDILEGYSKDDIKAESLGYFEASSAMQNGQLDGMNAEGGIPTSAVAEIAASKTAVKILGFSDEQYNQIHDVAPYYGQFTIPGGLYTNIDEDIKTIGIKSALVTSANVDEETIYQLTKAIYENYDEMATSHKALENVKIEEALKGLPPVPLHKGALRYYEEKGIDVPEELKGN